jgi:uncharacterized protein (TIGR02996 family)
MTPEEAFLQALIESPDDDTPRLIFADWLEERGDSRGEFLRLECRLRSLPESCSDYGRWYERLAQLAGEVDIRWLAAVCRVHLETGPSHAHPRRCPLNVVGPFYTCGGCLACEAPEHEAPDLLAELGPGNSTTYFVRQPRTAAEIERACQAALVCCVADVRYGGTDPKIITRLGNDPLYCDHLLVDSSPRLVLAPPRRLLWESGNG